MSMMESPSLRWMLRAVVLLAAAGVLYYFWPSDVSRVEKNTRKMLGALSKSGNESLPVSAARSLDAVSYLASNVVLSLGEPFPPVMRKSEITPLLQQVRMRATTLNVKSLGHEIERQPDGDIAMDITIDASVEAGGSREHLMGTYRLTWRKFDRDWRITRAEVIEVIHHPSGSAYPY